MRIINENPPIVEAIKRAGLRFNPNTTIFAYGDAIYNPANVPLENHLIVHECTHLKQQKNTPGGADAWWERYLEDKYFRITQEAEAYGAQYGFLCDIYKDRNRRYKILMELARFLSGEMYGSVITLNTAMGFIKDNTPTK